MNWLDPFGEFKNNPAGDPLREYFYKILAWIIGLATFALMAAKPDAYPLAIVGGLAVVVLKNL